MSRDDITLRLRAEMGCVDPLLDEAAAEIERLRSGQADLVTWATETSAKSIFLVSGVGPGPDSTSTWTVRAFERKQDADAFVEKLRRAPSEDPHYPVRQASFYGVEEVPFTPKPRPES